MLAPDLVAWVEEAHDLAAVGVECGDAVAFVIVTERAGEPKVIFFGRPPSDSGMMWSTSIGVPTTASWVRQ
jgi:hypothetical protein